MSSVKSKIVVGEIDQMSEWDSTVAINKKNIVEIRGGEVVIALMR